MVVGERTHGCQVAVIGGGPGGYLAAIRLAQLGKDVALIEQGDALGGVCLNEGCIPSKALIHAADLAAEARAAHRMGVDVTGVTVDVERLVAWKDRVVKKLTDGVRFLVGRNGVEILRGRAAFVSARRLEVRTDAGTVLVDFEQAVIAVGSSPRSVPGFEVDGELIVGAREALSPRSLPKRLVVVGGGYIGLEMGALYRKLGAEVAIVESHGELVPNLDREVARALLSRLRTLGVDLRLGTRAESLERGSPAGLTVAGAAGDRAVLETDRILVCIGRVPNSRDLGLERAGVETDARGFVRVDSRMETSAPGIYALGDVVGGPLLAHKAYREAKVAAEVIAGQRAAFDNVVIPGVIYTDPEVAWAGRSETEARAEGLDVVTGTFPFRASGRALTLSAGDGFVKTVAEKETHRILGITIVGNDAGEMIAEAALAIEMGARLDDVAATIHPHPSLSEAVLESVEAALGHAIHV
jgi:dihydrolipoamide dehydrogenase